MSMGWLNGGDDAAYAERQPLLIGQVRAVAGQYGLALGGQKTGVVAEPFRNTGQLGTGLGDRPPVVTCLEGVELLTGVLDGIGDAQQEFGALTAHHVRPRSVLERRPRCRDRGIDVDLACSGIVVSTSPVAGLRMSRN